MIPAKSHAPPYKCRKSVIILSTCTNFSSDMHFSDKYIAKYGEKWYDVVAHKIFIFMKFRKGTVLSVLERKLSMSAAKKLIVNEKWCKGCGVCAAFCPKEVLQVREEKVMVAAPENCILCGLCELRCPDYAIYLEEVTQSCQ